MKTFPVWLEGYRATGESGTATYLGDFTGDTFHEACKKAVIARDMDLKYYDPEKNTFWACRFFYNEVDARKSFG